MKAAAGLHKNVTALATSPGVPQRPRGRTRQDGIRAGAIVLQGLCQ